MNTTNKQEPIERAIYRQKCKHYCLWSGQCYLYSVLANGCHLTAGCDGNCRRMKNYDKKYRNE